MPTAVHINFSETKEDASQNFNYRCFTILAGKHPGHHFIFIFDKPFDPSLIIYDNITAVLVTPQIKNRLLRHYWYNYKIPRLLNRYNADLFIGDNNICCLRTPVKQCMILQDLSFLQKENLFSKADIQYLKKYFGRFLSKAERIAVPNQYIKTSLIEKFPLTKNKTYLVGYGSNDLPGLTADNDIAHIKESITEGKEYFVCYVTAASGSNTTIILKAFSAFKKRQLSNMQLVLLMTAAEKENPVKDFSSYKYRDDVKIIWPKTIKELTGITTAAYAAIYLPSMQVMEDTGLLAFKNNIPLITTDNGFYRAVYNDAALYTGINEKNIAEQMMLIYKDENLKKDLINKSGPIAGSFSWDHTAAGLWHALTASAE